MRFSFPYSHAFHGGRIGVHDDGQPGPTCTVEFSDGSAVIGQYASEGEDLILSVPEYRTAKGTTVRARTWKIAGSSDGVWRTMRT
jgi:hypothetical protein